MSDHRRTARLAASLLSTTLLGAAAVVALPAQAVGTPTASFTVSPASPAPGQTGTYDASASTNSLGTTTGLSYAWDFNADGVTDSTAKVAYKSFPTAGQYPVELTVTDASGSNSKTVNVLVGDKAPVATYTGPGCAAAANTCTGLVDHDLVFDGSASFDPDAGDSLTYAWSYTLDNGQPQSLGTGHTATHSFHVASTAYVVKLVVTDAHGATSTVTKKLSVTNTAPTADIQVSTTANATQEVSFDGSGSTDSESPADLTYGWDFGDGATVTGTKAQAEHVTHTYAAAGLYQVELTVTDPQGLSSSANATVAVGSNGAPTAVLSVDHDHQHPGVSVQFDGTQSSDTENPDVLRFEWNFGDGNQLTCNAQKTDCDKAQRGAVAHTYAAEGDYTVTLKVIDGGDLSSSATLHVYIGNWGPTASYTGDHSPAEVDQLVTFDGRSSVDPEGGPVTYDWSYTVNGGPPIPLGTNATAEHAFHEAGTYAVSLTVTDQDDQFSDTRTTDLTVTNGAPTANATATPAQPAAHAPVAFDASSSTDGESPAEQLTYAWDFDDNGTIDATGVKASHTFTAPGPVTVKLTVTDPQGAAGTKSLNLLVQPNAQPTADTGTAMPNPAKVEQAVAFDGSGSSDPDLGDGISSFEWEFGDGTEKVSGDKPSHVYHQAGTYTVTLTVTDDHGATGTDTVDVTVTNTAPTASISATPSAAGVGKAIAFKAGGSDAETPSGLTYAWTFGDGGTSTAKNPGHTYTKPGIFSVGLTVTDPQGLQASATRTVKIVQGVACQSTKVTRTGSWRVRSSSGARGGSYCDNRRPGSGSDTLSLGFTGPQVGLTFARSSTGGTAKVYVDGVRKGTVDFHSSSSSPTFGHRVVFGGLGAGSHKVRVVVSSGAAYVDDLLVWGPLT